MHNKSIKNTYKLYIEILINIMKTYVNLFFKIYKLINIIYITL